MRALADRVLSTSDETIWFGANCVVAQVDFPTPAGPMSTTRHGEGRTKTVLAPVLGGSPLTSLRSR